jgi:hypothetical protein
MTEPAKTQRMATTWSHKGNGRATATGVGMDQPLSRGESSRSSAISASRRSLRLTMAVSTDPIATSTITIAENTIAAMSMKASTMVRGSGGPGEATAHSFGCEKH